MKQLKANPHSEKSVALHALRMAVIEGAIWRYEHLLDLASKAGASEEEIDVAAHEAAVKVTDRAAKVKIFADAKEKVRTTVLTDVQRQKLAALREKIKDRWQHKAPAAAAPATPKVPAAPTAAPAFPGAATAPIRI